MHAEKGVPLNMQVGMSADRRECRVLSDTSQQSSAK